MTRATPRPGVRPVAAMRVASESTERAMVSGEGLGPWAWADIGGPSSRRESVMVSIPPKLRGTAGVALDSCNQAPVEARADAGGLPAGPAEVGLVGKAVPVGDPGGRLGPLGQGLGRAPEPGAPQLGGGGGAVPAPDRAGEVDRMDPGRAGDVADREGVGIVALELIHGQAEPSGRDALPCPGWAREG